MFSFSSTSKNRGSKSIMNPRRPRPRLDRRNAAKNIEYDAAGTASFGGGGGGGGASSPETLRYTRSLDLSPSYSNQTSFRIGGSIEGEVDLICRSLGLSGPEEFAISAAAWEASRERRSSSDLLPRSRLSPASRGSEEEAAGALDPVARVCEDGGIEINRPSTEAVVQNSRDGGIKGVRPPTLTSPVAMPITTRSAPPTMSRSELNPSPSSVLAPPPSVLMPELDKVGSPWDLIMSFAPDDDEKGGERRRFYESEEEEEEGVRDRLRAETSEDVTSTSNDDDSWSTATDISPIGRFKRTIKDWIKGGMLGSGSFGTVYEGINGDGFFFAVKEVSLLGHGSDAQQCILQLEQEIALLSQFEHENVVQYYGTEKDPEKLFIFLELVTQGSLVSLYQKYHLRDSQVSAYTRQILKGLNYLHERNVVHRDIKCANILVHASGSVKLADFGLAKQITKINVLKSCKGSVYWMAPEVVKPRQPYGPAADIWSLGCTVLEMLTRQVPYPNMEWIHVLYKVGKGEKPSIPPHISTDARDFITQCIQVNPSDRPSASQLLEHPFVRRSLPFLGSGPDYSSSPSFAQEIPGLACDFVVAY